MTRNQAFPTVLASSITFFVVCIAAVIFGLAFGGRFHVPSLTHASGPELVTYIIGLAFPGVGAFSLLSAWVRFSGGHYKQTMIYAFMPWTHFTIFMILVTTLLRH